MKPEPKPVLKPTPIPLTQARFLPAVEKLFSQQTTRRDTGEPRRNGQ